MTRSSCRCCGLKPSDEKIEDAEDPDSRFGEVELVKNLDNGGAVTCTISACWGLGEGKEAKKSIIKYQREMESSGSLWRYSRTKGDEEEDEKVKEKERILFVCRAA